MSDLIETLRQAQRFGFFGDWAIEEAVEHARQYVAAIDDLPSGSSVIDLGAGGGLPGLVVGHDRPDLRLVLLDRRQKRTDFLERAARRLGFDHVTVWCDDATVIARTIGAGRIEPFDGAIARGFGPPEFTLRTAHGCVRHGGVIVISEPPAADRWDPALLAELGVTAERRGAVMRFTNDVHS
jgi:16S rRNA (guanine527-N7)-methyltransferase